MPFACTLCALPLGYSPSPNSSTSQFSNSQFILIAHHTYIAPAFCYLHSRVLLIHRRKLGWKHTDTHIVLPLWYLSAIKNSTKLLSQATKTPLHKDSSTEHDSGVQLSHVLGISAWESWPPLSRSLGVRRQHLFMGQPVQSSCSPNTPILWPVIPGIQRHPRYWGAQEFG